jgi:hypothetical protein
MLQAIEYFVQCAEESNQEGGDGDDWDYSRERTTLQSVMIT